MHIEIGRQPPSGRALPAATKDNVVHQNTNRPNHCDINKTADGLRSVRKRYEEKSTHALAYTRRFVQFGKQNAYLTESFQFALLTAKARIAQHYAGKPGQNNANIARCVHEQWRPSTPLLDAAFSKVR